MPAQRLPTSEEAAAYALGAVLGAGSREQSLEVLVAALQDRIEPHRDPLSPAALDELRRQLPLLQALFQRLSVDAMRANGTANRSMLIRSAMQCQQAHSRTVALLHGLELQAKGRGTVALDDHDS